MYTAAALLDLHTRTQRSLQGLLDHLAGFSAEELDRELDGFGFPSIRLQLHHLLGAERYWVSVLQGAMQGEVDVSDCSTVEALRTFREEVAATTIAYLETTADDVLNAPRTMTTWGGKAVALVPAHVLVRTQTHVFQHQGQIAAMARLLGRPLPRGLDFPLT
jgi:uncharacterized damage-inducible protein DinB